MPVFSLERNLSARDANFCAVFLQVVYMKAVIELLARFRNLQLFDVTTYASFTREIQGACLCANVLFWPLYNTSHWTWRLNALVPAVMFARFFYKGAVRKDPEDADVQVASRSSSPSELLFGPLQCSAVMVWLGLYRFMTQEAAVLAAALGVGDSLVAPVIGKLYGRHVYQMPLSGSKTMEGTVVGVFLGTVSACYVYLSLMGIPLLPLRMILVYGGIAAVVEGTAFKNLDNLAVAVTLSLSFGRVQEWLPA